MTTSWEDTLDECEARLDAADAALAEGRPVAVDPFVEPEVANPIPAELEARARTLAARTDDLGARLAVELERVRSDVRRLPRFRRSPGTGHIDTRV